MSSDWFSGDVVANGIKLHYTRTGGDGPPVVLAHGITDNGLCWTRLAQALEGDYDLIMFDARGHGLSDVPEAGYAPQDHAADLAGLVEALGLDKPALIGHSMGAGNVATAVADYPNLARCAVLEDPPWRVAVTLEEARVRVKEWRADLIARQSQTREEIIAALRERSPMWAEVELGPWADANLQVSPRVLDWIESGLPVGLWQDTVRRITCPLLVVTADPELGAIVTPEIAEEALGLCATARIARIRGAGHSIRREQFEPYVEAVSAFLEERLRA